MAAEGWIACLPREPTTDLSSATAFGWLVQLLQRSPDDPRLIRCLLLPCSAGAMEKLSRGERSSFGSSTVLRRNARERNRVKMVNEGFSILRQHIPHIAKQKKLSKVDTLRNAVEYIRNLQRLLARGENEGQGLGRLEQFHHQQQQNIPSPGVDSKENDVGVPTPTQHRPPSMRTIVNFSTVPQGGIIIHRHESTSSISSNNDEQILAAALDEGSFATVEEADSTTPSEDTTSASSPHYEALIEPYHPSEQDDDMTGALLGIPTVVEEDHDQDLLFRVHDSLLSPPISSSPSSQTSSSPPHELPLSSQETSGSKTSHRRDQLLDVANLISWGRFRDD
ncbi:unnamed protein product [Cyprideis torosa]|uniref:Uncharacterized protein n=1 Tax=Cyprideis torosa TaxID=163714 RepID=A0A7R8W170_9CRUS|nr:unnamed protein product [Cyprideis torosa]CAG0880396.1 unnamed protein product [Cyprideis torosa]